MEYSRPVTWVLDVDGVVWLAGRPIPGSPEAIHRLRSEGERVVLLSNNSGPTVGEYCTRLAAAGVPTEPCDIVTSAQAAASLVSAGDRVAVVGDSGILEALGKQGAEVVEPADRPDAVVVGRTVRLDHDRLAAAASAVRGGARFVATNADPTYPTPTGPLPGAGALVAYIAVASGREPEVAGKPHRPVADLLRARVGAPDYVVGDRPDTDGGLAEAIGAPFVLVLSGSTSAAQLPVRPAPVLVAADLAEAVAQLRRAG